MAQQLPIPMLIAGGLPHVTNAEWQTFCGQTNIWEVAEDLCLMVADPNIIHPVAPPQYLVLVGVPGTVTN